MAVLHITTEPPSLRQHVSDLPPALDTLVLRTLSKDPAQRPSAKEFADLLRAAAPSLPQAS